MSSDDAKPLPVAMTPGDELLKYLAIGRLYVSPESGELVPEKHRLVAHNFARKNDPDPEWTKQVKSHIKAVMKRAGHKLTPGKRIRLKDDQAQYEVHILTDEQDGDPAKTLVFFAVTSLDFPKYHSVPAVLKDLKGGFFQTVDAKTLWNGGSVQKACQPYFARLMAHYGSSPLLSVQTKVDQVSAVMASSVNKALAGVERMEDMDAKSDVFVDQSQRFHKRTAMVKTEQKNSYRKLTCLLCTAVLIVVIYFIVTAVNKIRGVGNSCDLKLGANMKSLGSCPATLDSGAAPCNVECSPPYWYSTPQTSCQDGDLTFQTCLAPCTLPTPTNGQWTNCTDGTTLMANNECSLVCNAGFTANATMTTCANGVLAPQGCVQNCNVTLSPNQEAGDCPLVLLPGSACQTNCTAGFVPSLNSTLCSPSGLLTMQACVTVAAR